MTPNPDRNGNAEIMLAIRSLAANVQNLAEQTDELISNLNERISNLHERMSRMETFQIAFAALVMIVLSIFLYNVIQ